MGGGRAIRRLHYPTVRPERYFSSGRIVGGAPAGTRPLRLYFFQRGIYYLGNDYVRMYIVVCVRF